MSKLFIFKIDGKKIFYDRRDKKFVEYKLSDQTTFRSKTILTILIAYYVVLPIAIDFWVEFTYENYDWDSFRYDSVFTHLQLNLIMGISTAVTSILFYLVVSGKLNQGEEIYYTEDIKKDVAVATNSFLDSVKSNDAYDLKVYRDGLIAAIVIFAIMGGLFWDWVLNNPLGPRTRRDIFLRSSEIFFSEICLSLAIALVFFYSRVQFMYKYLKNRRVVK